MKTKRWRRLFPLFTIASCIVVAGQPSTLATTVVKMSDQDIVRGARIILEGKVTKVSSQWNAARTRIYTFVDISVSKVLKGSIQGQTITLRVLGGAVGNIGMVVVDSPTYAVGQEIILLLGPNPQSSFPVVGFNQGKFTIEVDPATQQKTVKERGVRRHEFITHIERIIAEQQQKAPDDRPKTKQQHQEEEKDENE